MSDNNEKELYSYHCLLFPFKFELKERKFDMEELKKKLEDENWVYKSFTLEENEDYNNYMYFYDYSREVLFNIEGNALLHFIRKKRPPKSLMLLS